MRNLIVPLVALVSVLFVSNARSQEVNVSFTNGLNAQVDAYWVTPEGQETRYGSVPPNQQYNQPTYPGHRWRFKVGNQVVGEYVATGSPTQTFTVKMAQPAQPQMPQQPVQPQQPQMPQQVQPSQLTGGGAGGAANQPINFQNPPIALIASEIVRYTNIERQKVGLAPLQMSNQLQAAAQMHANDMVAGNFFSHVNPNNPAKAQLTQRVTAQGATYSTIAENIGQEFGVAYKAGTSVQFGGPGVLIDPATGQALAVQTPSTLAQGLVTGWMNSQGHRENILRAEVTHIGCGVSFYVDNGFNNIYRAKGVQVFSRP